MNRQATKSSLPVFDRVYSLYVGRIELVQAAAYGLANKICFCGPGGGRLIFAAN